MLLYHHPQHLPNLSAATSQILSRPRLALDTHHLDNLPPSTTHNQVVNLDNNYSVEHSRLPKSSHKDSQSGHYHYEYRPPFSSTSTTSEMFNQYPPDPPQYDDSPSSSPQAPQARPSMSFPQPLSAPHDQPAFGTQNTLSYSSRYGPDRHTYQDPPSAPSLDRRMSEPALLSGNHPSAFRAPSSVEQPSRYSNPYGTSSTYSPPNLHYSRSYTEHSRGDSTGSSSVGNSYGGDYRPPWATDVKQEDGYSETNPANSSNYSPRPSTASTGVEGTSPLRTYSISATSPTSAVSVSPDPPNMPPQRSSEQSGPGDYQPYPSSPSNSSKTYAFVSLPGTTIRKRPRRRYDEIERLYHCSWPDCSKAYGTLNHLNAHVVMQKHGARRLPSEFKELRKQWRKAKKEGTFTPPSTHSAHPGPSTPSSSHSPYPSPYYNSPASERRRRMTDPNPPPPLPSYRSPNSYHSNLHVQSNLGGSGWIDEPPPVPERRYPLSYSSSSSSGAQDVYGGYSGSAPLPPQGEETYRQIPSTTIVQPGYSVQPQSSSQDQYGQGFSYPLPSPPGGHSSHEQDTSLHNSSNVSPSSPSSHHRYSTSISSSSVPLNRLSADSALLNGYRPTSTVIPVGDGEESPDGATPGSRSTGSEYDEPRGSYDLHHSHSQQPPQHSYGYDDYQNDGDRAAGPYSLGRNRLPRDSTLLTPLNLEHMRYGSGKGV